MNADGSQAGVRPDKHRPKEIISLLHGGRIHAGWNFANQRASRFFVVNLAALLGKIPHVLVSQTATYFAEAAKVIDKGTDWNKQQPFVYVCSHTQISRDNMRLPKTFGRAATIAVAIELIAAEKAPELCVYDSLRILAADQFPDYFDSARLAELEACHRAMSPDQKAALFGAQAQKSFEEICLIHIEQTKLGLLAELAAGGCVTHYTADKLCQFIAKYYPPELHIGPILSAGEDAHRGGLGDGPTVEGLHVPRNIDPAKLAPWS